jgi:broad specificity phosphatase PhoE
VATFTLLRHGEADFSPTDRRQVRGWGGDLAPLSSRGVEQVRAAIERIRPLQPVLALSSPMTRAMHSTMLVATALGLDTRVEFDLHEWIPDLSLDWTRPHDVERHLADLDACDGEWPAGECRRWEPLSAVRTRASVVLDRYATYGRVLVVTHGTVIRALTGVRIGLGEIAAFERT